jgi:hypothetical protein
MLALVERSPDIFLDEIQDQLLELQDLEVSLATISRTLKRLGMSSKKVCVCYEINLRSIDCFQLSQAAAERCEADRQQFAFEIGQYPPEYLVAADEAAVNVLTTYRTNGWAIHSLRARKKCCFVRGQR